MTRSGLLAALFAVAFLTVGMVAAPASTAAPSGTVKITITAPVGVPATVDLAGRSRFVAVKGVEGTTTTATIAVPVGAYRLQPKPVIVDGRLYEPGPQRPQLGVGANRTVTAAVVYQPAAGAAGLEATAVGSTSISLSWTAPGRSTVSLRRTSGDTPVTDPGKGTAVPVTGNAATDGGLQPGTTYSYSLFTRVGNRWAGPVTVTAGTAAPAGSTDAAYVASAGTLLAEPAEITSEATTGAGVRVQLDPQVPTRVLGSAVVLPQSAGLPGGFLGTVAAMSADGRTLDLVAGGLGDAFDHYSVSIPDAGGLPDPSGPAGAGVTPQAIQETAPQATTNTTPKASHPPVTGATRPGGRPAGGTGTAASAQPGVSAQAPPAAAAQAAPSVGVATLDCDGGAGVQVAFVPTVTLGGHFTAKLDTKFGVPTSAALDMSVKATMTGAVSATASAGATCDVEIQPVFRTLTAHPVPISVFLQPTGSVSVAGSVGVGNIGVTATAGVAVKGTISATGTSFTGYPIASASPLTPTITANGEVEAKVGGELLVGPGAGTSKAGVIAGVGGRFDLLHATFHPAFSVEDARFNSCLHAKAEGTLGLLMKATAWVGSKSTSKEITVPALKGTLPYGEWDLPTGCPSAAPVQPGNDLLGAGVTKVSDSTVGSAEQWGHTDGFAPGHTTWVLSTGRVADAIGSPEVFASTALGQPGDEGLSGMSGNPTHDAASYQVTLVPAGDTLHVQYVFASEEYPEFVQSQYNDVMGVFVDGSNCATVPGTDQPVSVNTVNALTNMQHYVDNSTGAAGYSTSMDGLTTPLTCSVPVTPGEPVTVRVAVADASDEAYDSAIALIDKGIWTD